MRDTHLQNKLPRVPLAKQGRVIQQAWGSIACRERSQEQSIEAEDLCLNRDARVDLLSLNPSRSRRPREETTDWKAGCGKTACPVWREGRGFNPSFLPLSLLLRPEIDHEDIVEQRSDQLAKSSTSLSFARIS